MHCNQCGYVGPDNYKFCLSCRILMLIGKDLPAIMVEKTGNIQTLMSEEKIAETQKDMVSVLAPKLLDVSIQTKDLIELAVDIWRIEQRFAKVMTFIPKEQKVLFENSIQKLKKYLNKNDVEIIDHTNQTYNEGRNLDIISVEKGSDTSKSIIKQTVEPTIMCKNQVVHKGKVVVLEKNSENFSQEQK